MPILEKSYGTFSKKFIRIDSMGRLSGEPMPILPPVKEIEDCLHTKSHSFKFYSKPYLHL